MSQVIRISSSLYDRLGKHAVGFESPASVIEKLLNHYEGKGYAPSPVTDDIHKTTSGKLDIVLYPPSESEFKKLLLDNKAAWVLIHKSDGTTELKEWNAHRLTSSSSILGNLRSGYLRGWKEKGIVKAEIAINKEDILE